MKKTTKTINIIIIIIFMAIIVALIATVTTYSIWVRNSTASEDIPVPVDDYNPSEKYIVFKAIYSDQEIVAYAAVGYTGLVAELIIPSEHLNKPVTKICTDETQLDKRFASNPIISSIYIPNSVTEIAAGAFQSIASLKSVEFESGDNSVAIGNFAFANCPDLTTFTCSRGTTGASRNNYLLGCPAANQ